MKPIFFFRSTIKSQCFLNIANIIRSILFQIVLRDSINLQMNIWTKVCKPKFEIVNKLILIFDNKTKILLILKIQNELIIFFAFNNIFELLNGNLLLKCRLINQINKVGRQYHLSVLIDSPSGHLLARLDQKNFFVKFVFFWNYSQEHIVGDHLLVISVHLFCFIFKK